MKVKRGSLGRLSRAGEEDSEGRGVEKALPSSLLSKAREHGSTSTLQTALLDPYRLQCPSPAIRESVQRFEARF